MSRIRSTGSAALLLAAVFASSACSNSTGPGGGADDVLAFANSTGVEVTVDLTLPGGGTRTLTLPASSFAEETRTNVSFVEGEVYTFVLSNPSPSIAASASTSCTVAAPAVADGVAGVLVLIDTQLGRFRGDCLTNWVES